MTRLSLGLAHSTPTGLAEEVYQRGKSMPIGRSGVPIPWADRLYRPSMDADLLRKIHKTAFGAYERRVLTWERQQQAGALLAADIERRFPLADMLVLERYGHAKRVETLHISLPGFHSYRLPLALPVMVTGSADSFTAVPDAPGLLAPIPEAAREFFDRCTDIMRERADIRGDHSAVIWTGLFRKQHGRAPRWHEIESTWPIIGNWLAAERGRIR